MHQGIGSEVRQAHRAMEVWPVLPRLFCETVPLKASGEDLCHEEIARRMNREKEGMQASRGEEVRREGYARGEEEWGRCKEIQMKLWGDTGEISRRW